MEYLELTIQTSPEGIEPLAAILTAAGFDDLVLEDQQELEGFLDNNRAYWDYIDESLSAHLQGLSQIKLYLEKEDEASLSRLKSLLEGQKDKDYGSLELKVTPLAPVDYEESWKENYPPQEVGKKLVVVPYWLADAYEGDRLPIVLDPGLTFGTGAHPSTQMVMGAMEDLQLEGKTCLDLGSGSGILSLTALRLGAKEAVGVDIDPKAEDIARENAAYNGFGAEVFTALTGNVNTDKKLMDTLRQKTYDLVCVNIVADVIIALAPTLPQFLEEKSTLLLSGILDTRLSEVLAALQQANLSVTATHASENWRCLQAKRRAL